MHEKKDLKFSVAVNGLYFSTLFDHGGALVILSSKLLLKLHFFLSLYLWCFYFQVYIYAIDFTCKSTHAWLKELFKQVL